MTTALREILDRWRELPPAEQERLQREVSEQTASLPWVPNPGPQTEAYFCEADELFYGGQAGPGKTDLIVGLSLTKHRRSLVLRRTNKEAAGLVDRYEEIIGDRDGWSSQLGVWRRGGRHIEIGGCQLEADKQKYKGKPRDLYGFDEIPDFTRSQYKFITGWLRSTTPGQRCRVVAAGNPPTTAEGLWVIDYWGPWLNPKHPRPAKDGELRWYAGDEEVAGPGTYEVDGKPTKARSRTFIRGELSDNPDLAATDYDSVLANMPEHLRDAYRGGRFDKSMRDSPWQLIPTDWVQQAFNRWRPDPPSHIPMVALGVDPAAGGPDRTVIAPRHDWWYAPLIAVPGIATPRGRDTAGLIVANRQHNAHIVLDMGGGYGGSVFECLIDNVDEDTIVCFNGANGSSARSRDGKLGFVNKRAEAYWKFREALDPSQPNGSPIALPPDQELLAELTSVTFDVTNHGVRALAKDSQTGDSVKKRLGRSPDKGDAVVMAWAAGARLVPPGGSYGTGGRRAPPRVNLGKRRR